MIVDVKNYLEVSDIMPATTYFLSNDNTRQHKNVHSVTFIATYFLPTYNRRFREINAQSCRCGEKRMAFRWGLSGYIIQKT
jgi:hypothetical protein